MNFIKNAKKEIASAISSLNRHSVPQDGHADTFARLMCSRESGAHPASPQIRFLLQRDVICRFSFGFKENDLIISFLQEWCRDI